LYPYCGQSDEVVPAGCAGGAETVGIGVGVTDGLGAGVGVLVSRVGAEEGGNVGVGEAVGAGESVGLEETVGAGETVGVSSGEAVASGLEEAVVATDGRPGVGEAAATEPGRIAATSAIAEPAAKSRAKIVAWVPCPPGRPGMLAARRSSNDPINHPQFESKEQPSIAYPATQDPLHASLPGPDAPATGQTAPPAIVLRGPAQEHDPVR
jgi:hypothetical protein